jgi:hypothetical protein
MRLTISPVLCSVRSLIVTTGSVPVGLGASGLARSRAESVPNLPTCTVLVIASAHQCRGVPPSSASDTTFLRRSASFSPWAAWVTRIVPQSAAMSRAQPVLYRSPGGVPAAVPRTPDIAALVHDESSADWR